MMACMKSEDYRADLLLYRMRPAVNDVLAEVAILMPGTIPTCASMSQKAIVAIRRITGIHISQSREWAALDTKGRFRLHCIKCQLEDFMAVWNTVNIMEYPDNHAWFRKS